MCVEVCGSISPEEEMRHVFVSSIRSANMWSHSQEFADHQL